MAKGKHGPAPGAARSSLTLHPNSRRVARLNSREQRKQKLNQKMKSGSAKIQAQGEKMVWIKDNLPLVLERSEDEIKCLSNVEMLTLIEAFLSRFHEELEQIRLKTSIGNSRSKQHRSRFDLIEATMKREREEFQGCGLEMPDLTESKNYEKFTEWNGEIRYVQNIAVKRFKRNQLESTDENNQQSEMSTD